MSPVVATTSALVMCRSCGGGPLLDAELKRGTCANCYGAPQRIHTKCRLCTIVLGLDDDRVRGLCLDCATRPEAKRVLADGRKAPSPPPGDPGYKGPPQVRPDPPPPPPKKQLRAFTPAEKSLIKHSASFLPAAELLRILNERLHADLGADVPDYTLEQLQAEIGATSRASEPTDWAGMRQVLAIARRTGILTEITAQVIEDFATVFQLSPAQLMTLKDVIRSAREER